MIIVSIFPNFISGEVLDQTSAAAAIEQLMVKIAV